MTETWLINEKMFTPAWLRTDLQTTELSIKNSKGVILKFCKHNIDVMSNNRMQVTSLVKKGITTILVGIIL